MIYRSNLECPDLSSRFTLLDPPMQHMGHDTPSDPDFLPACTYFTHDEAAILYAVGSQVSGAWVDIGSRMGWTSAHLEAAGCLVIAVDPEYKLPVFLARASRSAGLSRIIFVPLSSFEYFSSYPHIKASGAVIDGCHDSPEPSRDASWAAAAGAEVILFHDFQGMPVRDAVRLLMGQGWKCRVYDTPNGVALCWRDKSFVPPGHVPDPSIDWAEIRGRYRDFDFAAAQ